MPLCLLIYELVNEDGGGHVTCPKDHVTNTDYLLEEDS